MSDYNTMAGGPVSRFPLLYNGLPVIGILVLITVANDQLVTMVAAYVLCGELLCVLVSRILNLYYIDVAFVWLGGIMLWLWYWLWLESSHVVMEIVEKAVE